MSEFAKGGYIEGHGDIPVVGDLGCVITAEQVRRWGIPRALLELKKTKDAE